MAHFDYIKPGGVWSLLSLLSSSIMAEIDRRIYKSVNGDEGGVWAPTPTAIIIGGLGLQVTGPFEASNADITITSGKFLTVESGGTVDCQSGSTVDLYGAVNLYGTTTVDSGATINCAGSVNVTDGLVWFKDTGQLKVSSSMIVLTTMLVDGPGAILIENSATVVWATGTNATHQSGSATTFAAGSTVTLNGAMTQGSASVWTLNGTHTYSSTAVITTSGSTSITLNNKPTLNNGMTIGGTTIRTSSQQDHFRLYDAPNASGSILFNKDVVKVIGNLGTSKTYKILDPLSSVAADECIIKHIVREPTNDATVASFVRDDITSTLICRLGATNVTKGATLVYYGSTSTWELLGYSGLLGTDVFVV